MKRQVFTEGEGVVGARESYGMMNDHVLRFLSENFVRQSESPNADDTPHQLKESEVYDDFKDWCESEGVKRTTKSNFREGVERWTGNTVKRIRDGSSRVFVFEGLIQLDQWAENEPDRSQNGNVTTSDLPVNAIQL